MNDGIFDVRKAHKLDTPGRVKDLRPVELLRDVAGIADGDTGIDLGSGTGMFTLPMAELVGSRGRVYAIDDSEAMMEHLRSKNPPANITLVKRDVRQTGLNGKIADVCLLAFILHEVTEPVSLITEAFRLLKSGGRLVIVEWKPEFDSPGPPRNKRFSKEQIEQFLSRAGLRMEKHLDWSQNHYVALAVK